MKQEFERLTPAQIEQRSFEIIIRELGDTPLIPGTEPIVRRCIHTSADFDYAKNLRFSPGAVEQGLAAVRDGALIVTDTQMAAAGINKKSLTRFGGEVRCFMSDPEVAREAAERGVTRASVCMERAAALDRDPAIAVGNAPTALIRLYELMEEKKISPRLIIGVPVGFVNVTASKELIMTCGAPWIVARGRKGGSNIAACICNALLYMAEGRG